MYVCRFRLKILTWYSMTPHRCHHSHLTMYILLYFRKDSSQKSKSSIDGDDSSVRERTISSSTMSKWTPLSEAAKSLLLDAITYPSRYS